MAFTYPRSRHIRRHGLRGYRMMGRTTMATRRLRFSLCVLPVAGAVVC